MPEWLHWVGMVALIGLGLFGFSCAVGRFLKDTDAEQEQAFTGYLVGLTEARRPERSEPIVREVRRG